MIRERVSKRVDKGDDKDGECEKTEMVRREWG